MQALQQGSTLQGGRYRIERVLGQGGFGITYLAVQSGLERKVAIKEFFMKELCNRDGSTSHVTLGTEGSRETVARFREKFLKEARNIARLNHPHIVRIYDIFEENGTAYYVMEYAEGGSLADLLKRRGCLSEPDATCYILQVAEALAYIHAENMNHLDVKPANILLNDRNEAILIDFGLSKQYDALTGGQTSTTPVGISEGYAPMEQYKQGGVSEFSPETDIYALGATFFKLLTGKTPPSSLDVNEDGVPVDELKARGVSLPAIDLIVQAMEPKKKGRMKDVRLFINNGKNQLQEELEVTVLACENAKEPEDTQSRVALLEKNQDAPKSAYANAFFFLSLNGRIGRCEYIGSYLLLFFAASVYVDSEAIYECTKHNDDFCLVYVAIGCFILYVALALGAKRCHDIGASGWNLIIPVWNIVALIVMMFEKEQGDNRWGTVKGRGFSGLGWLVFSCSNILLILICLWLVHY